MKRLVGSGYRAVIGAAEDLLPPSILRFAQPDYLCGVDPLFAGLHRFEVASYGRTYRDTAHVVYPLHQEHMVRANRATTVVLPTVPAVGDLVHELGHVVHERLAFEHEAAPLTWYARTNHYEAFAEAFASWLMPGYGPRPDDRTVALFESLAAA